MRETKRLNLQTKIESVDEAAAAAESYAREMGFTDDAIYAIDLGLRESVANAVKHGNKLDESKPVEISFAETDGGMEITVRDFGSGFSVEDIADPTDPENLLKSNGRGILFMRSFMDDVEWSNPDGGGLMVRMVKKL